MPRPNIVFITPHDLGTHLRCYGWDSRIPSPNLDGFAREGVQFRSHFCAGPYCSPSRGAIMTGLYPHVNGLMGLVNLGWDLPERNVTLPQLLQASGYETGLFGIQHIVSDPARLGYEHMAPAEHGKCELVAGAFEEFLRSRSADASRPFYAEIGTSEVHRPYGRFDEIPVPAEEVTPLPFLEDTPGVRMDLAMFYAQIQRLDRAMGRVFAALDEAGLRDETLVVFTTDHGIAFPRAKATLYGPGINTALMMRWPGRIAEGREVRSLTSHVDIFPTIAELLELEPPPGMNGTSLVPLLEDGEKPVREAVYAEKNTYAGDLKRCVRTGHYKLIRNYGEGPKLHLPTDIEVTASRRDLGDVHLEPRPPVELYDLQADPWEQRNRAGATDYAEIEADLAGRLERHLEETDDPILGGSVPRPEGEEARQAGIRAPEAMSARQAREAAVHEAYYRTIRTT
jgi:arylsulfatase A-like enzyme